MFKNLIPKHPETHGGDFALFWILSRPKSVSRDEYMLSHSSQLSDYGKMCGPSLLSNLRFSMEN